MRAGEIAVSVSTRLSTTGGNRARRCRQAIAAQEDQLARRTGDPLSIAIIDVDHFKRFNDTYGHPAGDRLLKEAAAAWQEQLRTVDRLARYGGEEFVVLLPDATIEQAREVVDRMRQATPLGQTFSAGVAAWNGTERSDELTGRADTALYVAKDAGRNRIAEAEPQAAPA